MRPSSGPLPQGSSSSRQPPVDANTLDNHDGQDNSGTDVDTWSSTDRLDSSSEWILRDSPDIDVTESKELDWGTE
jgi:aminoglycoside phosphotransferase (APT) family kinase protein